MSVIIYTLIPVAASILGGVVTALQRPSDRLRSIIQHIAAGVVFAAAAAEILPDVLHSGAPLPTLIGSTLGVAVMLGLELLEGRVEGPFALSAVSAFDIFIDGFVLGLAFLAGTKQGLLLSIALTLELLFLGLSVAGSFTDRFAKRPIILGATAALSLMLPVGVVNRAGFAGGSKP